MLKSAISKCRVSSHHRRFIIRALQTQSSSVNFSRNYFKTSSTEENDADTHFGFQTVKESEKAEKVHKVFEEVAKSYDLMNDAMSFGIHRLWKDIFIERLGANRGTKLLDMAGGTGSLYNITIWTEIFQCAVFCR